MTPERLAHELDRPLRANGFAWLRLPCGETAFVQLTRCFGTIVDDTPVRVIPGKRTYLARPDPIPLHIDHPKRIGCISRTGMITPPAVRVWCRSHGAPREVHRSGAREAQ